MRFQSDSKGNSCIELAKDAEYFKYQYTYKQAATYIKKGASEKSYGDYALIEKLLSIKNEASFLHVPEERKTYIEDNSFVMEVTKQNEGTDVFYKIKVVNGIIVKEYYQTSEGIVDITYSANTYWDSSSDFINSEDFVEINTLADSGNTIKVKDTEFYSYDELLRKYPQVTHVLNNDYVIIENYEQAEERLKLWINSKEQLKSYDIESYDKYWGPNSTNRITGIFLGLGTEWSTYFPFRQENFDYNLPIEYLAKIKDAINNQPAYPEVILLAHNVKFEEQGFYQEYREFVRCDIDTFILAVLVNPKIQKGTHTLKNLTSLVDHNFYLTLEQIFKGPVKFNILPPNIVKLYGCPDATSPAKLYPYLMERLPKDERFVLSLEMELPIIKALEEFYGVHMDQDRLNELIEDEQYKVEHLGDLFRKIHRTSQNINSNAVLTDILYNKLRCKVEIRTKKGAPSTSKAAIDHIIDKGAIKITDDTPIPEDIVDKHGNAIISGKDLASNKYPSLVIYQAYKKCVKELGALNRLRNNSVNGFFKFYINQVGAGSNRQTSDAHQFSDTMKSCAIADTPHHGLVSCDWKQVELRILAGLAGQKDLIELESDPEVDIHRAILSIIQGKPMYMISEEDRKAGKSVNFGVVYMMTEYGLARKDFGPAYTKNDLIIERKKITDFYNGLPYIKKFVAGNRAFLMKHGYIKTAFNYYRYFKELLDPTYPEKKKESLIRSGNNTPVQGTGAQMLKMVEVRVWDYIKKKGWDKEKDYDGVVVPMVRMILPIHDEILLSYDKSIPKEEIISMFKECMELDIEGMPPFYAAPAFIDNWYQGKDSAYEVDIPLRDKIVEEYHKGNYLLKDKDYLQVLTDYRNDEIASYMSGLISKYKTIDDVAKHVTDNSLTHVLIETMLPKKERKALSHTERIYEATKRYMDQNKDSIKVTAAVPEKEDSTEYIPEDEWLLNYTHIDSNGEYIVESADEEEDADEDDETTILSAEDRFGTRCNVLYLMSECIIDFTGIDKDIAEEINQEIQKLTKPDAYYDVIYVIGNKSIKTNFKIDYIVDTIDKLFNERLCKQDG